MKTTNAVTAYQSIGVESRVEGANPHQLVAMLLRGLLDRLAKATGAIRSGDVAVKGRVIGEAISIIDSLRASIDMDQGGDVAVNLISLYDFVENHLVQANIASDTEKLQEARNIIMTISDGWESISGEVKHDA